MPYVYIRLNEISLGSFKASSKAVLLIYIGSPSRPYPEPVKIQCNKLSHMNHVWRFSYSNFDAAKFYILILKQRILLGNHLVGVTTLKLNSFEKNKVVSDVFSLHSRRTQGNIPQVSIDVHVDEDGASPFQAPRGLLFADHEVKDQRLMPFPI